MPNDTSFLAVGRVNLNEARSTPSPFGEFKIQNSNPPIPRAGWEESSPRRLGY
jgi:hypothetical protein